MSREPLAAAEPALELRAWLCWGVEERKPKSRLLVFEGSFLPQIGLPCALLLPTSLPVHHYACLVPYGVVCDDERLNCEQKLGTSYFLLLPILVPILTSVSKLFFEFARRSSSNLTDPGGNKTTIVDPPNSKYPT